MIAGQKIQFKTPDGMKKRKEVHLTDRVISMLQAKAGADGGRSLKNYMEKVLINDASKNVGKKN